MSTPLAVVAPQIGARSETFVRRHMEDLLPSGTSVIVHSARPPYAGHWTVDAPLLNLNEPDPALGWRPRPRWLPPRANPDGFDIARWFLRKHEVRVLMVEYLDVALTWLPVARELGIRFFAHAHGYDVSERLRDPAWRERYLALAGADGIVTVSSHSRDRLVELGLPAERIRAVPCGVDVPASPPSRAGSDTVTCLAVGRLVVKKSPVFLLDAFRRAAEAEPGLRLEIVGDGELLPVAEHFVHAFDLGDLVTLHGAQPPEFVADAMAQADIFVQHSVVDSTNGDEEGLPVSILEAMANALPVVSTRHAGIGEAVDDGVTGFLVAEGDSPAMGERIAGLARDASLRNRLGVAGWRRAGEAFSWPGERAALLEVLGLAGEAS